MPSSAKAPGPPLLRSGALLALLLVLLTVVGGCEEKREARRVSGPDFELKDIEGNTVRLSDYRGKVVLLEFWATWCPPCRLAVADLIRLDEKYKGKDFALISVSIDEPLSNVKPFAEENGITYPVLIDDKHVSDKYGVRSIPTAFVLTREGGISTKHLGYAPDMFNLLSKDIEAAL